MINFQLQKFSYVETVHSYFSPLVSSEVWPLPEVSDQQTL